MQENLLFFGIPETEKQNMTNQTAPITQNENEVLNDRDEHSFGDREINQPENTEEALRNFIAKDLPTQVSMMASGIRFDRVHRLGARKRGMRNPRPIVAKFERYSDRELIRKAGMDLNSNPNSKFKVREQFPREIEERRKLLYPVMYRLKRENQSNKVNLIRDKLYVNGRLYVPEYEQNYRLPPSSPDRSRQRYQNQFSHATRPPPPPQPAYRVPDIRRNDRQNHSRYEQYDQGAIPKRYTGFQINQQTPVSNRYQCLSDENERSLIDRQPGQKHKFISPIGEQNSPKKQRDTGAYLSNPNQQPLIQEIVNVDSATTSTDTVHSYTTVTNSNTPISETPNEIREAMDTMNIQTGTSDPNEQSCV